jgi:outer membrane lipoprotein SlyB
MRVEAEMLNKTRVLAATSALLAGVLIAPTISAQQRVYRPQVQQRQDWDWDGNYRRLARINAGTFLTVRTSQPIESDREGRTFSGFVAEEVWDDYGRLAVPVIPQGSRVDMISRPAADGEIVLDLQTVYANGQAYNISAQAQRIEGEVRNQRDGANTAKWAGGGALLGSIIGAVAGGGKGAAIGAGAGAASGYGALAFRGRSIRIPAGSQLTFRLDQPLEMRMARQSTNTQNGSHR